MANKQFKVPINLVNLASDPGTASEGDVYYNTTSDTVKVYANGAWASIGSGGGGGSASDSFKTISVSGQSDVVADSSTDTLTIIEGTGITITTNANTDAITLGVTSSTYQPLDSELTALAGLTSAADSLPYFTGSGTASLATFTTFGRSLIDDADAATARTTLGLGTMATETASNYLTSSGIALAYQPLDADLTAIAALTGTSGFLTTNGSGTWTVDTNTYALNSALSSYAALSGATFTGNIAVNNSTSTAITTTGTTAAVFNTNATTLNIGGAATTISIGDTAHSGTTTVNNNLAVYGSITFSQGASSLSATTIQIDDTLISLSNNNTADILDVGFYAGYRAVSTNYHTGLVRDASDSGKWKLFSGISTEPTGTVDFTSATYDTLKIGALEVTDASTTRSNLGLVIGTNVQAYSATLEGINTLGSGTGFLKNTAGTWSYDNSTYLTTSSASTTYAPKASPTFTGTVTIGEAITKTTTTTFSSASATTIATFPITGCIAVECMVLISSTSNGSYTASKVLITADPDFNTVADITEYAVMKNNDYSLFPVLTATISGSNVLLRAAVSNFTATTAKVVSTSILSPLGAA